MADSLNVFDKFGKFLPLIDAQLAKLSELQRDAYWSLKAAVVELEQADAWFELTVADNRKAVELLREAEAEEAKRPKRTFLDELRATQAQWRREHP